MSELYLIKYFITDDFGAFTSSQPNKKSGEQIFVHKFEYIHCRIVDLAGVSLHGAGTAGVAGSSSTKGLSGLDKYSALAQLDVAVKEVTLKDTPPSNEKLSESWGSSGSGQNVNPFGAAPAGVTQPQQNPFMATGPGMQQQGFGQFVSAQPQGMPQQGGWAQPQGPMYNNPQQATAFGNAQFQGQAGFSGGGGFVQQLPQQQQGMFGAGGAAQFSGGFPQQQRQWQPTQQMSQQRPQQQQQQQWQQQQWQQPQQSVFGNASQSFGGSKSTSAASTSSTSTNLQLGWSSGLAKPVAATSSSSAVESAPGSSSGGTGWSTTLTAPAPQPTGQMNWNTPTASGNMQQQNWGGSGSSMQQPQQPGGGWGSTGQQTMFGAVPQQQQHQNQMFGGGTAFGQPNQMSNQIYMAHGQQPQMFGAPQQQQQMFGMPNQQQQSFGTWSQNSNPQQQGGFNWNNQAMPGGLQRKDSKNIIVGNWGTQPSNSQSDTTTSYVPNNMNTSNPFTVSWEFIRCMNLIYHLFVGIK